MMKVQHALLTIIVGTKFIDGKNVKVPDGKTKRTFQVPKLKMGVM